ncbi:MAG: hypothetical protein GF308_16315 [Candidatus Heimdallarchaeota archaeon]|nr:hypothetical protein [Candidatus Heimdallarchaeota archaeon]
MVEEQVANTSTIIEGFFLQTVDDLIFDVKGITHPKDKKIAYVRYVPIKGGTRSRGSSQTKYKKIYDLEKRYKFIKNNYPHYLFNDPKGRGLLQVVPHHLLKTIFDPRIKLVRIREKQSPERLEKLVIEFVDNLLALSDVSSRALGISGSILVDLPRKGSDIDLVVYGRDNGQKLYQAMPRVFGSSNAIHRYSREELKELWKNRGQEHQISFSEFFQLEKDKRLQGKIKGTEFYIRLVLLPEEYYEPYEKTVIESLGEIELEGTVEKNGTQIFTPCIYHLTGVTVLSKEEKKLDILPSRIFSVRGRYCELAHKGDRVRVRGKLEQIRNDREKYFQVVLGIRDNDFFKRKRK